VTGAAGKYLEEFVEKLVDEIALKDPRNGKVTVRISDLSFLTAPDTFF
jgi:hypothetical protein